MRVDRVAATGLQLACLALLSGCGNRTELVQFNDRVAHAFKKLAEADKQFYEGAYDFAYGKGPVGGVPALKRFHDGYDHLKEVTAAVKKETAALGVPEAAGARKFHDSFQRVLKVHEEILDQFGAARAAPEKKAQAQREGLRKLLDQAQEQKRQAWLDLDEAQKAFAVENRIKLK